MRLHYRRPAESRISSSGRERCRLLVRFGGRVVRVWRRCAGLLEGLGDVRHRVGAVSHGALEGGRRPLRIGYR